MLNEMEKVEEYYNEQTQEVKDLIESIGCVHTVKIMLFEFAKAERSSAMNWIESERKGRERMRKLYADKLGEITKLKEKNAQLSKWGSEEEEIAEDYMAENKKLKDGLQSLYDLKVIKDADGKTPYYLEQKPKAWEKVKELLTNNN